MFISNNNNPKHALRKSRSLRKPILAIAVAVLFCLLPIFSGLIGTFNQANAEVEQADWDRPLHSGDYWPLARSNRLVVTSFSSEMVRNPSLEFRGTYVNPEGRTVVRLAYRNYNTAPSPAWHILALKAYEPLESLIDWNNPRTVMFPGSTPATRNDWFLAKDITADSRFKPSNPDQVGTTGVHEVNLKKNDNISGTGSHELAIDLVLKEGKTLSDLKANGNGVDGLLDMRIMSDEQDRAVYTTTLINKGNNSYELKKSVVPYFQYTTSARIPSVGSAGADDDKWRFGLQDDILAASPRIIRASNAYVRYGVDKQGNKYMEVVHRMAKGGLNNTDSKNDPYAYRQVFTPAFADMLKPVTYVDEKGNRENNVVAIVYQADVSDAAYPPTLHPNFDAPKSGSCVRVGKDFINNSPDGKYKYIQVARKNDKDGFVKNDGTSADPASKTATTTENVADTFINGAASGFTGRPTITRYYIDSTKLNYQTFNNIMFYSAIITANTQRGFTEYSATTTQPFNFSSDETVNIDFDDDAPWAGGGNTSELQLIFGDKITGIGLWSRFSKPKPVLQKRHYEWKVPYDITIPAGTKIRLMGDSENNKSNIPQSGVTISKGTQFIKLTKSTQNKTIPKIIAHSDTIAQTRTLLTAYKPNIQEIFTDDTKIVGHSFYEGALAEILGENGDMNVKIPYDQEKDTGQAPESVVVNGKTKQGYKFTFEKPATNPEQNGWPSLEKDMPIRFNNTDILTNSIPSESVVEQVQAKVVFDLNGGTIPASGTSAPASYTNRTNETDVITRIAPLNANYRKIKDNNGNFVDNPAYKQNGFETADGAEENRKMVGGVLADHDDKALTGDNLKYRQFVSQTPEAPEGKYFKEWNTKPDGTGTKFEKTTPIDSGMTVYAIYEDQIPTGILPTQKKATDLLLPISLVSIMATFALILRKRVKKAQN